MKQPPIEMPSHADVVRPGGSAALQVITPQAIDVSSASGEAPFSHYMWVLRRHCWKILGGIVACVIASVMISARSTPMYEATCTIDIDRRSPNGLIGQEAMQPSFLDSDQYLSTQIKLIQSDAVLRPVAEKYNLLQHEGRKATTDNANAPIRLGRLAVSRTPNTYLLLVSYRSKDKHLAATVANAVAQSYLEHTFRIRMKSATSMAAFMERQLEELKAKMERSSLALAQFERDLNVINPEEKTNILSARLLQLNTEYTSAQADRLRKEAAYESAKTGTLEAAEISTQGEGLKKLTDRLNEAQERYVQTKQHFGANHPEYKRAAAQIAELQRQVESSKKSIGQRIEIEYSEAANRERMLQQALTATKAEFDSVNARSFDYRRLTNEAEADRKLYDDLVRKIREASINSGFQSNAVRIADQARPASRPVSPNIVFNALLALLISTVLAVAIAVLSDVMNNTVRDPEEIVRSTRVEVIGSLPSVKAWRGATRALSPNRALANDFDNGDVKFTNYDEAVRTLRNAILLTDFDRRLRTIMVSSSAPSEGKSTTAVHLAIAHAEQGRRTLIIDGDLRRPSVHRRFKDVSSTQGLTNVLTADIPWRSVIAHPEGIPNLDVLPAGPPSRKAADLIGTRLVDLLEDAGGEYDLIIVDTPPLLGFPEPLQIATATDGVLMVALANKTDRRALTTAVSTLVRLRANVIGIVLNDVRSDTGAGYYHHSYHAKYYKPQKKTA